MRIFRVAPDPFTELDASCGWPAEAARAARRALLRPRSLAAPDASGLPPDPVAGNLGSTAR